MGGLRALAVAAAACVVAAACGSDEPAAGGPASGVTPPESTSSGAPPSEGGAPQPEQAEPSGLAQKGPFQQGSSITVFAMGDDAVRIGEDPASLGQLDAFGRYIIDRLPEGVEWADMFVEGPSFNELTGEFQQLNGVGMYTLLPVVNGRPHGNINLLTGFTRLRALALCGQGETASLAEAREQALVELNAIFGLHRLPDELDLLHADGDPTRANDDAALLRLSAAFLASGLTGGDYDNLMNDFAQHGAIVSPDRVELLARWQAHATDEVYFTARQNVLERFANAPPADASVGPWVSYGCVPSFGGDSPTLCEGDNPFTLPANSGSGAAFVFRPPSSGSYAITMEQTQNDARHVFELRQGTVIVGQSHTTSPPAITTPPLPRGGTFSLSVAPNYSNVANDYTVRVRRLSDGHPQDSRALLLGLRHEVRIGQEEDVNNYTYVNFATGTSDREHFLIFDNLMIAKMRVELLEYAPDSDEYEVVMNQIYPSSPRELRIELPTKPWRYYDVRLTITEVEGQVVDIRQPILIGIRIAVGELRTAQSLGMQSGLAAHGDAAR